VSLAGALRVLAWVLLVGLVFVTLSPIDLRPVSPLPTQLERAAALAVIGFVFALAYPRHIVLVTLLVVGATVALEVLQLVSPSRHGRLADLAVKSAGALAGIGAGWVAPRLLSRRNR
jgi:hypothetical protein